MACYIKQSTMEGQTKISSIYSTKIVESLPEQVKSFYQFHGAQMIGSQFPVNLINNLYQKLKKGLYDGGQYFEILDNQEEERFEVKSKSKMSARSNVFLIDHAMTFKYPELRGLLKSNDELINRLTNILKYQEEKKISSEAQQIATKEGEDLQLDSMALTELSAVEFPKTLITLSLMNNELANVQQFIQKLQYLNLKVLWLNGNPIANNQQLQQYVQKKTRIQIFNSKFTKTCSSWGIKYAHSKNVQYATTTLSSNINTLNLDNRNIYAIDLAVLEKFTNLHSLSLKEHEITNQSQLKTMLKIIHHPSLRYIFVDNSVELQLRKAAADGLIAEEVKKRLLVNRHSFAQPLEEKDEKVDFICERVFRVAGCYRLASSQQLDESSCWYVNDELGSSIPHSDTPNVKIMPFLYAPNNKLDSEVLSFSLLWATEDLEEGTLLTKDYLNGIKQQKQRSSRLAAWYKLPESFYLSKIAQFDHDMLRLTGDSINLLQKFYNSNALKQREAAEKRRNQITETSYEQVFPVISDYEYINKYLKHERFTIVTQIQKAKIIWLTGAAEEQEWKKYKGKYFFNQFPYESCIVMKNNLASTVQTVFGDTAFLQRTFDLEKQLSLFIGQYYRRQKQGKDNLWILKPPNMARSMDMIITDNLPLIVRAMETGPKIAQKYITSPVLRKGRKVDLRYILLVKSISPLTLFLYKNFWIRSANNEYTVDRRHLSTYETQFTVMNYGKVSSFQQIKYKDFIEEFEQDYKVSWSSINEKIKKMLRNVFIAVGTKYPQMHDDFSRAVYGIDIMVDSESMEPKLLQITFSPDCKRACEYYPTFYDEIFHTLFLETMTQTMERII